MKCTVYTFMLWLELATRIIYIKMLHYVYDFYACIERTYSSNTSHSVLIFHDPKHSTHSKATAVTWFMYITHTSNFLTEVTPAACCRLEQC